MWNENSCDHADSWTIDCAYQALFDARKMLMSSEILKNHLIYTPF
jgi:hypothetical protein